MKGYIAFALAIWLFGMAMRMFPDTHELTRHFGSWVSGLATGLLVASLVQGWFAPNGGASR